MTVGIPKNHPVPPKAGGAPFERPRRRLNLSPDAGRYEQNYRRLRARFIEDLSPLVHGDLRIESIVRPGVDGRPLFDPSGTVFWRARFVLHETAAHRADSLLPELYRAFLRRDPEIWATENAWSADDRRVLVALVRYGIWKGHALWLESLAAVLHGAGLHELAAFAPVFEIVALHTAAEDAGGPGANNPRSDYYAHLVCQASPYYSFCLNILRGRHLEAATAESSAGESQAAATGTVSVKRLLWAEAAVTADVETEAYLVRRMSKNPPVDEDDLMDLYRSLAMRGKLFRAVRLLLRHQRHFGEKPAVLRVVLRLYLVNGKYAGYLRRLRLASQWPGRPAYAEAMYCVYRLGMQSSTDRILTVILADKENLRLPSEETRQRLRTALDVASSGHPPVLGAHREEWGDLVENHYLLEMATGGHGHDGSHLRERFRLYRDLVEGILHGNVDHGEAPRELPRLDLYFRTLLWTFEQYNDQDRLLALWPILRPLAGENLSVRLFFGLWHFERDESELARRYLESQAGFHPALLHARSELALQDGDLQRAESIYRRLLRSFPESGGLLYNLGMILERAGRMDEALAVFRQVLELEPRHQAAHDRIQLLT